MRERVAENFRRVEEGRCQAGQQQEQKAGAQEGRVHSARKTTASPWKQNRNVQFQERKWGGGVEKLPRKGQGRSRRLGLSSKT